MNSYQKIDGNDLPVLVRGDPSFDNLAKWEKETLINPLLDVIKEFYQDPKNRQAYQDWRQTKALVN
ncbi:MAG: hypothetical protein FWC00_01505 [Firmicutes bacterium]|nr:hypothetical protein [Bacillota bacterium]